MLLWSDSGSKLSQKKIKHWVSHEMDGQLNKEKRIYDSSLLLLFIAMCPFRSLKMRSNWEQISPLDVRGASFTQYLGWSLMFIGLFCAFYLCRKKNSGKSQWNQTINISMSIKFLERMKLFLFGKFSLIHTKCVYDASNESQSTIGT